MAKSGRSEGVVDDKITTINNRCARRPGRHMLSEKGTLVEVCSSTVAISLLKVSQVTVHMN